MKGLLDLAKALNITYKELTLAQLKEAIKTALNKLRASGSGANKITKAAKIHAAVTAAGFATLTAADGEEVIFEEGDSLDDYFANLTDEGDYQSAIQLAKKLEDEGNKEEVGEDYGRNKDGDVLDGYALLPRKTFNDEKVFQWSDEEAFKASKKTYWGINKFRVDNVSMREEVHHKGTPGEYQMVDFAGVMFTDKEPAGLDITIQFNTNYLRRAQSIFGTNHKNGVPQLNGKSIWINAQVSEDEAGVSILESSDPAWVAIAEANGRPLRTTKTKKFCHVISRTTSNQYSGERIVGVVSSDDIKTIKDMIGYRAIKTVDVEFEGKSKESNLEFLTGNVEDILALKAKGFSTADILAFLK